MQPSDYAPRMQFEHDLINRRLTWLITSESLLFTATGLALSRILDVNVLEILKIVAVVGFTIPIWTLFGILASMRAKWHIWQDYKQIPGHEHEEWWVRTAITKAGFVPDILIPATFVVAWACVYATYVRWDFGLPTLH